MRLVLVLVAAALLQAPPRADFTGSWKMVAGAQRIPTANAAGHRDDVRDRAGRGSNPARHDQWPARPMSVVYPIIPSPKTPADPPAGDERRAYWDGQPSGVERGGTISGQTVSSKQALTLSPDGSEMTVERLVIVQHGYTLRGAQKLRGGERRLRPRGALRRRTCPDPRSGRARSAAPCSRRAPTRRRPTATRDSPRRRGPCGSASCG